MQRTETLKLIISGDGKLLDATLGSSERRLNTYKTRVRGYFTDINRAIGSRIKSMISNPLALIGGGAAIYYAARQIVDYESKLSRLGIRSNLTAKDMMLLNEEIKNNTLSTGQTRGDLLEGLGKFRDETGSLALGRDILQDMAIASTATGIGMVQIADISAQLNEKLGLGKKEIKESLNLLTAQGHMKGFSLEDLAVNGERLFAAASRFDMKGMGGLRSFSAFLSSAKESTGSPTRAVSAIEAILTTLGDKKHAFGFNFRDDKGNLKDIETIIKGIVKAAGGSQGKIDKLFGPRAGRALAEMAKEYRESKKFNTFDAFKNADQGNSNKLMEDFGRYTETSAYQLKQLSIAAEMFSSVALTPIIKQLSGALSEMTSDPTKLKVFIEDINAIAQASAGLARALFTVVSLMAKLYGYMDRSSDKKRAKTTKLDADLSVFGSLPIDDQQEYYKKNAFKFFGGRQSIGDYLNELNQRPGGPLPDYLKNNNSKQQQPANSLPSFNPKNEFSMIINIPQSGPVSIISDNANIKGTAKVNRGAF